MNPTLTPALSAYVRRRDRIGLLIVIAAVAGILLCLYGCGADPTPDEKAPLGTSTPEQIATAQKDVDATKADVQAAKVSVGDVAAAHKEVQAAKDALQSTPPATTSPTTQPDPVQQQWQLAMQHLGDADSHLTTAEAALGIHLDQAITHSTAAAVDLTTAQKSSQADQKREQKTEKKLAQTQDQLKQARASNAAKGWFEFWGSAAVILGIALIVCTIFAESIPVVGAWLTKLGKFSYEAGAALIGGGLLLITLAQFIYTIEKVIAWSVAGVAVVAAVCVFLRYWPTLKAWVKGSSSAPAAPPPAPTTPVFPASGK